MSAATSQTGDGGCGQSYENIYASRGRQLRTQVFRFYGIRSFQQLCEFFLFHSFDRSLIDTLVAVPVTPQFSPLSFTC